MSMLRPALGLFVFAALLAACPTVEIPDGDADNGENVFGADCASCHGGDAKSGSAGVDLPGVLADDGENAVFSIIQNGKGGGMPAFKGRLDDQEIADVMAYIATL